MRAVMLAVMVLWAGAFTGPQHSAHGWFQNAWTVHVLDGADPAAAGWAFDQAGSFESGTPADGFTAAPVWRETSLAQFRADLAAGAIPPGEWVSYDIEKWAATPLAEQQHPVASMEAFTAAAAGHPVALLPARDLGLVDTECPKVTGEDLDQWFIRCDIAAAAAGAGLFQVQSQVDTADQGAFAWLVSHARAQARAANPGVLFFDGVSDNYGTPAQAAADEQAVTVDGTYVTCANSDVSWEAGLLGQLAAAGW